MGTNVLGDNIKAAIDDLSEANKTNRTEVMRAIGNEIEDWHSTYPPYEHDHDNLYYTETELDAGQLDNRYYTETEIAIILDGYALVEHDHDSEYLGINAKAANSELLDGIDSTGFSLSAHNHDATYLGIAAKAANSELLDNHDSSYFSIDGHTHDGRYYTETELNNGQLDNRYFTETEMNTTLGEYFKLNESETVTGRPVFNGGTTGSLPPFYVDSTFKVPNLNADLLDGLHASDIIGFSGPYIRSDADDDVSGHTEWQDTKEVRLGNDADFRMVWNGTQTIFKSHTHGAHVYFQGENDGGITNAMLYMDPNTAVSLYYGGNIKLATKTDGVESTGKVSMPIGTIYTQFNGKSAPSSLFYGTWTDRSSTWAGRFFRATGGAAAAFGTPQDDAFQGHKHSWTKHFRANTAAYAGISTANSTGGSDWTINTTGPIEDANGVPRIASETRPINYAIKIWERTA